MQRKFTKQSPGPTAKELRHMSWVKNKDECSACGRRSPLFLHHCEGSSFRHNKILAGHWFILGLCPECDKIITFGSRRAFTDKFGPQSQLWLQQLGQYPLQEECPAEVGGAILDWGR